MASSPSPLPAPDSSFFMLLISKTPEGQFLRIQLSVLTTTVFLFLLLFLGTIRRFVRFRTLKYLTKIIYVLIPISITYIMGLMHNASTFQVLYPLWACVLVYAYGGVVTMTACDLSDNEATVQYFCSTLPLLFWTGWLLALLYNHTQAYEEILLQLLSLFLVSALLNMKDTLVAFHQARKSRGLPYVVEPIVEYMRRGKEVPRERADANSPLPMTRYRYLVWDTDEDITTEEIWKSVDTHFPIDSASKEGMKDMCLSYAFFRLILRRFADFPIDESSEPRTARHFIREVLLVMDLERVFHVIEVELQFLFDFFYTKSHIISRSIHNWVFHLIVIPVVLVFYVLYGLHRLISPDQTDQAKLLGFPLHVHFEVVVTWIVMVIYASLEIWKSINVLFSNRSMVCLLYRVCRRISPANDGRLVVILIKWIWNIKKCFSKKFPFRLFCKPWQRQLGQYSFLESYTKVPILSRCSKCCLWVIKLPRAGQTGDSSVKLSEEVKEAVITHLLDLLRLDQPVIRLSRGTDTIQRRFNDRLFKEISHYCRLKTDAHVILVWHIATSLCAESSPFAINDTHFLVATQLSKYCAYLVTFAPELLPGHPFDTERLFDMAVQQAKRDGPIYINRNAFVEDLNEVVVENTGVSVAEEPNDVVEDLTGVVVENPGASVVEDPNDVVDDPNGVVVVENPEIVVLEEPTEVVKDPNGVATENHGVNVVDNEVVQKGRMLAEILVTEGIFSSPNELWIFLQEFWTELLLYLAPSDNVAIHGEHLAKGGEFITHLWALLTHAGVVSRSKHCPPHMN